MEWTQIKVSVSSRHYNMKWVDGEIFGNWDTEEATYLPQTAGDKTRLSHISQRLQKRISHAWRELVRQHGYYGRS